MNPTLPIHKNQKAKHPQPKKKTSGKIIKPIKFNTQQIIMVLQLASTMMLSKFSNIWVSQSFNFQIIQFIFIVFDLVNVRVYVILQELQQQELGVGIEQLVFMGNQQTIKVVILDAFTSGSKKDCYAFKDHDKYSLVMYQKFQTFIQKQNPQNLKNIIVRYVPKNNQIEETKSAQSQRMVEKKNNNFQDICPLIKRQEHQLKDEIISYIKKYKLHINIFLYVDETTTIKLEQHERPYIKLVSSDFQHLIKFIHQPLHNSPNNSLVDIMFQGLSRKIMLKILKRSGKPLLPQQKQLLRRYDVSFKEFNSIQDMQKNNISTSCQYVLCYPQHLPLVIDSKNICQQEYRIIIFEKDVSYINNKMRKYIWQHDDNLQILVKKMKSCSHLTSQQKPKQAKNVIVCGDDQVFINNHKIIQQQLKNKFKDKNFQMIVGFESTDFIKVLERDIYSFVVVFTQDEYLEKVKNILRLNNFHFRVQLTSIPNQPFKKVKKDQEQANRSILYDKKKFLLQQIQYVVKFQIGPIFNIHLFKSTLQQKRFFQNKIGIKTYEIKSIQQFKDDYMKPNYRKIIESNRLVCNVADYIHEIQPLLEENISMNGKCDQVFEHLKIIIMDSLKNIKLMISDEKNYNPKVIFIDYDLQRIEQHIKYTKVSSVSIPFFRKSVLTYYQTLYKKISLNKSITQLSLDCLVVSSNQVLRNIFTDQVKISTEYVLELMHFPSCRRNIDFQINFFENAYLDSYAKLWYLGYYIFQVDSKKSFKFFQTIKQQICYCFYKCKSYGLLTINQQDFNEFYINQIKLCNNFFDLQVACIYILSMPHGFNQVLSQILKNPRKSKLAIKVFLAYVIILITSFYQFGIKQMSSVQLVAKLNGQKFNQKFKTINQRDILFTNGFTFCTEKSTTQDIDEHHSIIFSFENIQFLEQSRLRSYVYIQKYAFYKEGAQYVISPYVKFQVSSVKINSKGFYQIRLNCISNSQNSFFNRLLKQNKIAEEQIWKNMYNQIKKLIQKNRKKIDEDLQINNDTFLFRKTELKSMAQSKQDAIRQFQNGEKYDQFFKNKNEKKYLTAYMHLHAKIKQLQTNKQLSQKSSQKSAHQLKMLAIQQAYINFKIGQYVISIRKLESVQQYLKQYNLKNQHEQKIQKIRKFITSVKTTFHSRRKAILSSPKWKSWKVQLVQKKIQIKQGANKKQPAIFKLKTKCVEWQSEYDIVSQIFQLNYKEEKQNIKCITKAVKYKQLVPLTPKHQIGRAISVGMETELFAYPFNKTSLTSQYNQQEARTQQLFKISSGPAHPTLPRYVSGFTSKAVSKTNSNLQAIKQQYHSLLQKHEKQNQNQSQSRQQNNGFLRIHSNVNLDRNFNQTKSSRLTDKSEPNADVGLYPMMSWSVFYFDAKLKIVEKNKRFHLKPIKKTQSKSRKNISGFILQ